MATMGDLGLCDTLPTRRGPSEAEHPYSVTLTHTNPGVGARRLTTPNNRVYPLPLAFAGAGEVGFDGVCALWVHREPAPHTGRGMSAFTISGDLAHTPGLLARALAEAGHLAGHAEATSTHSFTMYDHADGRRYQVNMHNPTAW